MGMCHHWSPIQWRDSFKRNAQSCSWFQFIWKAKSLNCNDQFLTNASISKMASLHYHMIKMFQQGCEPSEGVISLLIVDTLNAVNEGCTGNHNNFYNCTWNTTPHKIQNLIDAICENRNYSELITKSVRRRVMTSNQVIWWTSAVQSCLQFPLILCSTHLQKLSPHPLW